MAVLERPHDFRNIGAVIRNVDALGVEKTYIVDPQRALPDDWQDMRDRGTIFKSSVSAVKWSFVKRFDSSEECFEHLRFKNFSSIVTSPHQKGKTNVVLHEGDYTVYPKLAVWFGSEATGISDFMAERSELNVTIPMYGMVERLNLGTTTGIVLHEIARQRRDYQSRYTRKNKRGEKRPA
ncbi:TrmH family RNA methyltransferase [Acuticoccus sediminis]|uniref:TrmH family RNA methyltransferase n=1 Tax=Acuticoccus sediminis TaxID=2184697 RepID=UPI002467B52A|nr:RNA methyltransferase [Acuticoccus sediminis]